MELRTAASPRDVKHYTTERLREEFLIDDLFQPDVIKLVYSHIDRIITGSAVPVKETLKLTAGDELRASAEKDGPAHDGGRPFGEAELLRTCDERDDCEAEQPQRARIGPRASLFHLHLPHLARSFWS